MERTFRHYIVTNRPLKPFGTMFTYRSNGKDDATKEIRCGYFDYTEFAYDINQSAKKTKLPPPEISTHLFFPDEGENKHYDDGVVYDVSYEPLGSFRMLNDLAGRLSPERPQLLVFIHGYNNKDGKYATHIRQMHEVYYRPAGSKVGAILFVYWASEGITDYKKEYHEEAPMTGRSLAVFLLKMQAFFKAWPGTQPQVSMIVQSMGNVVLLHLLRFLHTHHTGGKNCLEMLDSYCRHIFMTAPDLDSDAFREGSPQNDIRKVSKLARKVHILYHENDSVALLSSMQNKKDRMSLYGPDPGTCPDGISLYCYDEKDRIGDLHRYFEYFPQAVLDIVGNMNS